jgi:hypothetical protein
MRGIQNPEFINPRVEDSRIRVSNILYALEMDSPEEQLEEWLEDERQEYDAPTVDDLDDAIEEWSGFSDTVVQFEDAVGVGRDDCDKCGGRLETDWDDYTLECQVCDQKYKSEEITILWREEDY